MPRTIAILENVRSKDVGRSERVRAIGLIDGTVETIVVLKHTVDIPVAGDDPPVVKAIVEYGVVIAESFVQWERVALERLAVKFARIDLKG
jgi:hypothetical protein